MSPSNLNPQKITQELVVLGNYDDYDVDQLIAVLQAADDLYYNSGQSFIDDKHYDVMYQYVQQLQPDHGYFVGVGSSVRGGKVKLPVTMGSLDQIYEGEIEKWVEKWQLNQLATILTDKLDGTSALLVYDQSGNLQRSFSRGNGFEGADTTRHLRQFKTVPQKVSSSVMIRGEIIIQKKNWPIVQQLVKTKAGTQYKNSRNCVAGLMNSETIDKRVFEYIDFVAYDIINFNNDKDKMLFALRDNGFLIPYWDSLTADQLNDLTLTQYLHQRNQRSEYEIDGVVIDVNHRTKREQMKPSRDTLNPATTIKYKVSDANNLAQTTVTGVSWALSKHGYLKPTIQVEPVNLVGVTISNCTGFNAKFINENKIGPGAVVEITRSGDVIPFCRKVVKGAKTPQLPDGDWHWNDTRVDIIAEDHESHQDVIIQQCVDFFRSLDVAHLKEGNVKTMIDENTGFRDGKHALISMINYDDSHWQSCIGVNGSKAHKSLLEKLSNVPLYKLMGACSFFGRGVGVRKFKKLLQNIEIKSLQDLQSLTLSQIVNVESFDQKTAIKITNGIDTFIDFVNSCSSSITIDFQMQSSQGSFSQHKVCFTGFRDKQLQLQIEQLGGSVQSSVTGKTTLVVTTNVNGTSSKLKKARDLNIDIIDVEQLKDMIQ